VIEVKEVNQGVQTANLMVCL